MKIFKNHTPTTLLKDLFICYIKTHSLTQRIYKLSKFKLSTAFTGHLS